MNVIHKDDRQPAHIVSRPLFEEVIVKRPTPPLIRHFCCSVVDGAISNPVGGSNRTDECDLREAHTRLSVGVVGRCLVGLLLCTASLAACSAGDTPSPPSGNTGNTPAATSTSVQVSVAAVDSDGHQLHYRWAATEGTINNTDTPTTTWTVPRGSGEQFAYVLVSDEHGGYTESRAVALTF